MLFSKSAERWSYNPRSESSFSPDSAWTFWLWFSASSDELNSSPHMLHLYATSGMNDSDICTIHTHCIYTITFAPILAIRILKIQCSTTQFGDGEILYTAFIINR